MNYCKYCKFFGEAVTKVKFIDGDIVDAETGFHTCDRIEHLDDGYTDEIKDEKSYVVDGSGYFAALRVRESFGCNSFEGKDG